MRNVNAELRAAMAEQHAQEKLCRQRILDAQMSTDFRQGLTLEQTKAVDELRSTTDLSTSGIACRLGLTREYVQRYINERMLADAQN